MKKWLKRFLWFLALTITGIVLLPVAWVAYNHVRWPPETFRYRVTLNVKYNGEIKSGSAVLESRQTRANLLRLLLADGDSMFTFRGVTPLVDLGEGGWVFLSVGRYAYLPWQVYRREGTSTDWGEVGYLPVNTPRKEIKFCDKPASLIGGNDGVYWVPKGLDGPKYAKATDVESIAVETGLAIEFVSLVIEKTNDPVTVKFSLPSEWPTVTQTTGGPAIYGFTRSALENSFDF